MVDLTGSIRDISEEYYDNATFSSIYTELYLMTFTDNPMDFDVIWI